MDRNKIRNGGLYLIDLKGNVDPEFGLKHYCVLVGTEDRDLYLAFPTTTSNKRMGEKYHHVLDIDSSIVLFKHTRMISKRRIIGEQTRNGVLSVLSEEELNELLLAYREYTEKLCNEAIKSAKQFHEARNKSKDNLKLECIDSFEINVGETLNYDDLVKVFDGGKLTHTEVSTKSAGEKSVDMIVKDKYGQKITRTIRIWVTEKEIVNVG
ncbi:hypothetical protein [Massilicoli timonensis]|uniref:hypothetical protein n=1 Tax=Massilicoli timonensis TaxID=2015901 RepID=UPI0030792F6A